MCSGAPGQNMPKSLQLWMTEALSRKQTGAVSLLASGTLFDLSYLILFVPIHTNPLFFTKPKDKAVLTPETSPMFPAAAGAVLSSGLSAATGWGSGARLLVLWTCWMSRTQQLLCHGSSFPLCYFVLAGSHILASCSSAHSQG